MSITASYEPSIVVPRSQLGDLMTAIGNAAEERRRRRQEREDRLQLQAHEGNIREIPCMDVMIRALERVGEERGGSLGQGFRDCNGDWHACVLSLFTPELPNGLGIDVDEQSGQVVFRYDAQGANALAADALRDDIVRAYAVIAIMRAQKKLGYHVNVEGERREGSGRNVQLRSCKGVRQ